MTGEIMRKDGLEYVILTGCIERRKGKGKL